jgi:hypothetical protein
LTPLEAFEMLYPISTVSYPLVTTIGLPYGAPIQGPMNFYQNLWQYVQVSFTVPYSVPDGYSIRLQLLNALVLAGSGYANFQSLVYTPVYTYGSYFLIVSSMGPITVGTVVKINLEINIQTTTLFHVNAYIDTNAVITAFTATKYVYYGLVEESGLGSSGFFFEHFYDNQFWYGDRIRSSPTVVSGH